MTNFMDQYLPVVTGVAPAAVTPVTPSAEDAAQLRNSLSDPNAMLKLNVAMDRDNVHATNNDIVKDYQNMDAWSFSQRYGMTAARDMDMLTQGNTEYVRLKDSGRSKGEHLTDALSGVTTGLVGGIGDGATFAGGMLNDDAGRMLSNATDAFRDFMGENTQTDANKRNSVLSGIRADLDGEDNQQKYQEDLASGEGGFEAGLAYVGRGLVNGAARFWEDPQSLEKGLTEGVGSLFAGGFIGKGLGIAGKLAKAGKATTAALMPAAIGAMEGGSAYSGAMQEVMGMTHEQLMKNSPSYVAMIASGMNPQQAQEEVAAKAATIAGSIQAPIGAITGKLVAGFETNPFGSRGFKDMVRNILNETVEEGIQSGTGQISQNLGVQLEADENQGLLEGVGDQIAQGAILGSLTAGVVQVPGVPRAALATAGNALRERAAALETANASTSGVTEADLVVAMDTARDAAPAVAAVVPDMVAGLDEETKDELGADTLSERITAAYTISKEDFVNIDSSVKKYLTDNKVERPTNRLQLATEMAKVVMSETSSKEAKLNASLFLIEELANQDKLFNEDIEVVKGNLAQDSMEYGAISQYQSLLSQISGNGLMQGAMAWAAKEAVVSLPEDGMATQSTVKNAVKATTSKPSALSVKTGKTILKQADEGTISITPEQRKALQNTVDVLSIAEAAQTERAAIETEQNNETDDLKDVSEQIMTRGRKEDWGLSIDNHIARINGAAQKGNAKALKYALRHFGNFAASQKNKANAAIKSLRDNTIEVNAAKAENRPAKKAEGKTFARLGAYNEVNPIDGVVTIYPDKPGSLALARRIIIEANVMIDQVNTLLDNNVESGIEIRLQRVELPSELFGDARATEAPVVEPVVEPVVAPAVDTTLTPPPTIPGAQDPSKRVVQPTDKMSPVEKKFPFLVRPKKTINRLVATFAGTRFGLMLGRVNPLEEFISATQSSEALLKFVGKEPNFDVTGDQAKALQTYLIMGKGLINDKGTVNEDKKLFGGVITRLNIFARRQYSSTDPEKMWKKISDGMDVAALEAGHALSILELVGDKYRYNPALLETAMLAALDWYSQTQNRNVMLDKEDIAKMLGIDISLISNEKVNQFNAGVGLTLASRSLADNITEFWGMDVMKDAPENLAKGIPEAIAKEILGAMQAMDWINVGEITMPGMKEVYKQYYFNTETFKDIRKVLTAMGPAKKLIGMAALEEISRNDPVYGKPSTKIAVNQMRNKAVKNTKTQRQVLRKAQEIAFKFYENSYDMQRAIGVEGWIEMMGSINIEKDTVLNVEHRKSIEGRNLTISMAFDAMVDQASEIRAYAEKEGISVADANKYYQFNYSRVDRLQMLGGVNPQSDKIARHVFLPTQAVLDLTDSKSEHTQNFFLSLAQGLGVKVKNFTPEANMEKAQEMLMGKNGKFTNSTQQLVDWLEDGKRGSLRAWSAEVRTIDPGITEHGIMSLLSAAEYIVAKNKNNGAGLASFKTYSYFEADGVTNGPANALMNLTRFVSSQWLKTVRKTGAFIGVSNQTMVSQAKDADLYETSANILSEIQNNFAKSLPKEARKVYDAMYRIMGALGMKITYRDDGHGNLSMVIDRGVLKNPLTITIYGSGIDGIAGNVANEIIDNFYAALSEHLQSGTTKRFGDNIMVDTFSDKENESDLIESFDTAKMSKQPYGSRAFWMDLNYVLTHEIEVSKEGEYTTVRPRFSKDMEGIPSNKNLVNLSFNENEFTTIKRNIRTLFVDQMHDAIDTSVMTHVKEVVDNIQKSTNGQSIVLHFMFRKELMRAMADRQKNPEKYPNHRPGDFMSLVEMDAILTRLLPHGAVINTEHQSFFLGAAERGDLLKSTKIELGGVKYTVRMPEVFSRDLMKQQKTAAYAYGPSIAGVAGVPSFNIGTGDGRMIDVFIQQMIDRRMLPVFDGINLPVDMIKDGSRRANAAVMQTWSENPVQYVAESLQGFLRQNSLKIMMDGNDPFNVEMDQLRTELTKNFEGTRTVKRIMGLEELTANFDNLSNDLTNASKDIGNRIEAMKNMPMSVDQMAGSQSGYTQKGTVTVPENATDAKIMSIFENEIAKVVAAKTKQEAVEAPSRSFVAAFKSKAFLNTDSGVLVAGISALDAIRKTLNSKLPNAQREMLKASLEALADSNYIVVFGNPDQIDQWELANFPDTYVPNQDNYYGKIDVDNGVIYLTNASAETLTHELIHAATIIKMQAYYQDKSQISQTDGEAIARLEGLMKEWLSLSYEKEGPAIASAHRMAISTIMGYMNQGKTAEAVNEFIAWSLSNQNIINLQKKTEVKNPLYRIMGEALSTLKRLIWGHKKAPEIGTDMFSNVRFNARAIMSTPTPTELLFKDFGEIVMYQSPSFGSNQRLSEVRKGFFDQMRSFITTETANTEFFQKQDLRLRRYEAIQSLRRHLRLAQAMAIPFKMNMQEISTFKMIGATLSMSQSLNTVSLSRIQDIFDLVIDKITTEDFMVDTGNPDIDRYQAEQNYNALTGIGTTEYDAKGRSSQLANFIALATVNEQFRTILRGMEMPKNVTDTRWKPDVLVERFGAFMGTSLANLVSGDKGKNLNMMASMDALRDTLIDQVGDQRSYIEQQTNEGLNKVDNLIKSYVEKGAKNTQLWAETVQNPVTKKAAKFASLISKYMTKEGTNNIHSAQVSFFNQPGINTTMREVINERIGRTESNAPIFDLITKTRTFVDQTRQRFREEFPVEIKKWFNNTVTKEQWSDLHLFVANTDAACLYGKYGEEMTLDLLSSGSSRKAEIKVLEKKLNKNSISKAKQLANFMVTGDHGKMLQSNAYSIAINNASQENEQDIDHLVTLYALEQHPESLQMTTSDLIGSDRKNFMNLFMALLATRNDEVSKDDSELSRMNWIKGHLKGQNEKGVHLVIDNKDNHGKYISMGYTFMGDYVGSTADIGTEKKGYYFAPVSGQPKFNQGTLQTVHKTQFGVDPRSGYSANTLNAGYVTDARAVAAITKRINNQLNTTENLRPIYNGQAVVVAYERMANPNILSNLNPDYDLARALGAWRGRQSEEMAAQMVNYETVDKVFKIWEAARYGVDKNQFISISKSTDPIHKDAWNVLPREIKDYIEKTFGSDGFMVRADMINDVVGGRSASIGDFWSGNSRWSPAVQKEIRNLIVGFGGNKAYRYLVNAESYLQEAVTDAKVLIVVKSMIVPAINIISNVNYLSSVGVPWRHIFDGMKDKTVEVNTYIKRREEERRLENFLFVAEGKNDVVAMRKLQTRIQSLKDSYKNLSIWPLLEAGEYGAITDGGISTEDLGIGKGGYAALIEKMVKKLPENVRDVGRYGLVTRDTALFKLLSRSTQYGDFLAKAVLYDHLTKKKRMVSNDAIAKVNEGFVNYNRFAGRVRSYNEGIGLTWFYQYKIRSIKIAHQSLHENPFRALLHMLAAPRIPGLGKIGSPIFDNMISALFGGRLSHSTGPGMLFTAPSLNPWWNLTN